MSPKSYQHAERIPLAQLIETNRFRLVMHAQFEQPCGLSELPVELELSAGFAGKLPFPVPWDKWLYGFVRVNECLGRLRQKKQVQGISLHDWGDQFWCCWMHLQGRFRILWEETKWHSCWRIV